MDKRSLVLGLMMLCSCAGQTSNAGAGATGPFPTAGFMGYNSAGITNQSKTPPEPCKQLSAPQDLNQPDYRQLTIAIDSAGCSTPFTLTTASLSIQQAGKEIPVKYLRQEPVSLGLLVDTSGSMEPKKRQA